MVYEKCRLLVVDDQAGVRKLIAAALKDLNCLIEQAADGAEAILKVKETKYQLVILDLKMPGLSGWEVLQQMRQIDPKLPVVLMTAYLELKPPEQMPTQPKLDFLLNKPFDVHRLRALIQDILRNNHRPKVAGKA